MRTTEAARQGEGSHALEPSQAAAGLQPVCCPAKLEPALPLSFSSLYQSSGTDPDPSFTMGSCVAGHVLLENEPD